MRWLAIDKVRIGREVIFNEAFNTFPWWHRRQESAGQCRGHRFDPWSGKIPHASEKLSLCAATSKARVSRTRALQ